jgi:hypothetical protein
MTKIYIIDADNCLSVEADLTLDPNVQTAEGTFTTQEGLATMTKDWPASRLVEVWNSFAGAPPFGDLKEVRRFTDRKSAVARIWNAAQRLGEEVEKEAAAEPAPAAKPKKAKAAPTAAKGAPKKAKATKDTTAKDAATGAKGPRDGSKTAQVVAMLERKTGATLAEIMTRMGWQRHTVRGFMAGAMKKAGYTVESFKPEGGDRTYRLCGAPHKR